MVLDDMFRSRSASETPILPVTERMASPADRFASFLIDFMILLPPPVLLSLAPLKHDALIAVVESDEMALFLIVVAMIAVTLAWVVGYQTICVWRWQGTLGQKFFKLRVHSIWQDALSLEASAIRACGLVFGVLAFGLPLLGVISNRRRRAFHDRISDSIVVALVDKSVAAAPMGWEKSLARGIVAGCFVVMMGVFLVALKTMPHRLAHLQAMEENACDDVSNAIELDQDSQSRMEMTMSLYGAGLIDHDCVKQEAYQTIYNRKYQMDLGFLALAFVFDSDSKVSNEYLNEVCRINPKGDGCLISQAIQEGASSSQAETIFARLGKSKNIYSQVWSIRHQMSGQRYANVLSAIERGAHSRSLAAFYVKARTQALSRTGQFAAAKMVATLGIENLDETSASEIAGFMCFEALENSCVQASEFICSWLNERDASRTKASTQMTLARFRKQDCEDPTAALSLLEDSASRDLRDLKDVLVQLHRHHRTQAFERLARLLENSVSPSFHREVARQWIKWAQVSSDVEALKEFIVDMPKGQEKHDMAQTLMMAFHRFNDPFGSLEMARAVEQSGGLNANQKDIALWAQARAGVRPSVRARAPASASAKEQ